MLKYANSHRIMTNTKTLVSFLLAGACLIASGCASIKSPHGSKLYQAARSASVEILVDGRLEGSGWFADPEGYVITAAHAVGGTNINIEISSDIFDRLPAEIAARDKGSDIALLRVIGGKRPFPFLRIAKQIPAAGSPVYLYGAALFHHAIMLGGMVAREGTTFTYYTDRQMLVRCYHVTAPSPPGTSGGPWIDGRGNVIGNQSGFITHNNAGAGIALVAPPDAIQRLVSTRQSVITPTLGCGLEELWTQSVGFIKRFPKGTEGIITIPIHKGGPVEAAGLNKESLIVAIEGKPIRYKDDLYDKTEPHDVQITLGNLD
jgi:serine protease Do